MKNLSTRVSDQLHLRIRIFAAHLLTTTSDAAAKAIEAGIPPWVGTLAPSEARAMARAGAADDERVRLEDQELIDALTSSIDEEPDDE